MESGKADLVPTDSQDVLGVRATTALRTIADMIVTAKTARVFSSKPSLKVWHAC
jgi:hypothetical protein